MSLLLGKTAVITGASRGIGRECALRLAKEGVNIVIAAKSDEAHPKLPGTIHSVAEEVKALGVEALPLKCDVRDPENVISVMKQSADRFGGIDILINNAGAINLTDTSSTSIKKFDLMHSVNARAVFLCVQSALPYLKKSAHAHVLSFSPPVTLEPKWLKNHVAYTLSKYGMSLCTIGMAEEFKEDKISFNSLWPRTLIATAAVEWLMGDEGIKHSRTPEIMADAACEILKTPPGDLTGQCLIDETFLRSIGKTEFDHYAHDPNSELMPDIYVEF